MTYRKYALEFREEVVALVLSSDATADALGDKFLSLSEAACSASSRASISVGVILPSAR